VKAVMIRGEFDVNAEPLKVEGTMLSLEVMFNEMISRFAEKHYYRLDRLTLYWRVNFIKRWSEGEHPPNLDKWDKYWIRELRERCVYW